MRRLFNWMARDPEMKQGINMEVLHYKSPSPEQISRRRAARLRAARRISAAKRWQR
jgi:hypothetical protein